MDKWDKRFLELVDHVASWSKDTTKVGAVIVNDKRQIVGLGYNGFPRGVNDTPERYNDKQLKYRFVVHAEANAILNANSSVADCAVYTNVFTCNECAKLVIQSGISRVISFVPDPLSHWAESHNISKKMYQESNVEVKLHDR